MNNPIVPAETLLHPGYEAYIPAARKLYENYRCEILEILGSYGFLNEIDMLCCMESRGVKTSERSDTQLTIQRLLKAVFEDIREKFDDDIDSLDDKSAKAAACYYVAYTDQESKDHQMLSFPWLFARQLLADHRPSSYDESNDYLDQSIGQWFEQLPHDQRTFIPNYRQLNCMELFDEIAQEAVRTDNEQLASLAQSLIQQWIVLAAQA